MLTPLVIVIAAIGMANVIFALDSIPAIFGLTQDAYIVLTANAFALMGLRQLYFLIGGLLERIVYLNVGLSVILAFIGVKLIIEALHGSHIDDIGAIHLPHIGIITSLGFIAGTLFVTTVVSLIKSAYDPRRVEPSDRFRTRWTVAAKELTARFPPDSPGLIPDPEYYRKCLARPFPRDGRVRSFRFRKIFDSGAAAPRPDSRATRTEPRFRSDSPRSSTTTPVRTPCSHSCA